MKLSNLTDDQLLAALAREGKALQSSTPIGITAEKNRAIIVRECHRRNLIGYPSGKKFRVK